MNNKNQKYLRLLAIAPSARGLGFAVLEGQDSLVDWGGKEVTGKHKNASCVRKAEELIVQYQPDAVVLEDTESKDSRRAPRIQALTQKLIGLAARRKVRVQLLSRKRVMRTFFPDSNGTKHGVAEIIAAQFPEELGFRLPPKRKAWDSEDSRMDFFDAVALCLALRMRKGR